MVNGHGEIVSIGRGASSDETRTVSKSLLVITSTTDDGRGLVGCKLTCFGKTVTRAGMRVQTEFEQTRISAYGDVEDVRKNMTTF